MQNGNSKSQSQAQSQSVKNTTDVLPKRVQTMIQEVKRRTAIQCLVKGKESEPCNHAGCRYAAKSKYGSLTMENHLKNELKITHFRLFSSDVSGSSFVRPFNASSGEAYPGFDMHIRGEWPSERQIFSIDEVSFEHHEYDTWRPVGHAQVVRTSEPGLQYSQVEAVETTDVREFVVFKTA